MGINEYKVVNDDTIGCSAAPTTKWWGYVLVFVIFAVAIALWYGLVYAEKRVFPDTVRLYTLPTAHVSNEPLPRRVSGRYFYPG